MHTARLHTIYIHLSCAALMFSNRWARLLLYLGADLVDQLLNLVVAEVDAFFLE